MHHNDRPRMYHRNFARECLTRALAALLEIPTAENIGSALVFAALAVFHLAASDPQRAALAWAESAVRDVMR